MGSSCQKTSQNNSQNSKRRKIGNKEFEEKLKYYATEEGNDGKTITIYQSKQNFIAKITYEFISRVQLQRKATIFRIFTHQVKHAQPVYRIDLSKHITCTHNYHLTAYLAYHTYSLSDYLNQKKTHNTLLDSGEVWYILKAITQVGALLQSHNMFLRKLDSKSVWISPTYHVKLPVDNVNHSLMALPVFPEECLILAPQELNMLYRIPEQNTGNNNRINMQKARVFSLGMLIIQCYTNLDSTINYYNYTQGIIDATTLNNDIKEISDQHLASLLSRMLQINPEKRIDFQELNQLIEVCESYQSIRDSLNIN